jgi:hypothetical protein
VTKKKRFITSTTGRQLDQPPSEAKRDELHAGPDCRRSLASGIAKISACHRSGELTVDLGQYHKTDMSAMEENQP